MEAKAFRQEKVLSEGFQLVLCIKTNSALHKHFSSPRLQASEVGVTYLPLVVLKKKDIASKSYYNTWAL